MGRIGKPIIASEGQKAELLVMDRSQKLERRYAERAKVILLSLEGMTLDSIEEETGLGRRVVNKWRSRFREKGIEGVKDAPRSGKPVTISAQTKVVVVQKACEKPTGGYTNWSQA